MGISAPTRELAAIKGDDTNVIADGSKSSVENATRYDPLADVVIRRWWDAVRYMQSDLLTDASVEYTLGRCYRQRAGVYEPDEVALVDGIDVYVPATDMKCMAAEAWLRDMLINSIDMPFTVQPTPLPELPERLKAKVLRDLKLEIAQTVGGDALATAQALHAMPTQLADMVFGNMIAQYPGDLQDLAAKYKSAAKSLAYAEAAEAAKRMELLIKDQSVEMKFGRHLLDIFHDLVTYPAAILKGPVNVEQPTIVWAGNRRTVKMQNQLGCYRVAVFDFKPSPDSPDTQRGTYVIEKTRMTKRTLAWAKNQRFWIKEQVDRILHEYGNRSRNWLVYGLTQNPEEANQVALWSDDETIDSLEHHGILSGRELRPYGISADDLTYYECKVVVTGGRTLAVRVNAEPFMAQRPYHATSYEKMGDRFWNTCPTMKMRAVQRSLNAAVRSQIRNMAFSSGPTGEADVSRLQRYVTDIRELQNITPYTLKLVDPDMMNGGRPAIQFHNVPQIIAPLTNTISFYLKMLDDVSNIPNYAQGDTGLGGAGRTFRGFSAIFAQALKVFKMPVQNLDADVFEPFATCLYDYNMTYSKDESIKGDAKVYAKGSRGLLDREMEEQKAMEVMKVVAQITPAVAQVAPRETAQVLKYTWARAMQVLGVPIENFGVNPEVEAALASTKQQEAPGDFGPGTPIPQVNEGTPPPG